MDNIRKLPAQLNTTWGLGHTINTNFQSLEQLYTDLKHAFGGLNFIQLYGSIPYAETTDSDTLTKTNVSISGNKIDFSALPSTTPGSAYLANRNIYHDLELWNKGEAGQKHRWLPMGTFIVSTNNGWETYNPVYTTYIYAPASLECIAYDDDINEYKMRYTYQELPISYNGSVVWIETTYMDTKQIYQWDDIYISGVGPKNISVPLWYTYPAGWVITTLIDPSGETYPLSYIKNWNNLTFSFYATMTGQYKISIDYGLRPKQIS